MIVFRRRLIYWLIKEYVRKWGKSILLFFFIGLVVFFFLRLTSASILSKIPIGEKESIGLVGAHTLDDLPTVILKNLSSGLTSINAKGNIIPDIASSWKIEDDGKKYIFYLKKDIRFNDGTNVTADLIDFNFTDAQIKKLDKYTLEYDLKESYSPFLVSVSRPILKKGLVGVGSYKIKGVNLNGNFIQSITLVSTKGEHKIKIYHFYPDNKSLKTAYVLGEISSILSIPDVNFKNTTLANFSNTKVEKKVNYGQLVTLFFNTQNSALSDRNIRTGLAYALPDNFSTGKRSYSPYPPSSWAYTDQYLYTQDLDRAHRLTDSLKTASGSAATVTIKSLSKYKEAASITANSWEKIGIKTKIEFVDSIPTDFQVFLGDFYVPKDPDQYRLWHSNQENNLTKYENKRIDKLIEDGRKIIDLTVRKKLYSDFQKYLLADSPAIFLYFPYEYEITRK
ncbi:MAG: hypothetical protein HYT83_02745 [Candidatus Levybacteria bacterium]|nr:hypothetical protein [Candidatus Levybacteria bacterium]